MDIFDQLPASGPISVRARLFAIVGSLFLVACMGLLIRKRLLKPSYSLLWLLMSGAIVILAIFSEVLFFISQLLGIYYVPATLFLLALVIIFLVALHFSLVITRLEKKLAKLTQEVALLTPKIRNTTSKNRTINRPKSLLVIQKLSRKTMDT